MEGNNVQIGGSLLKVLRNSPSDVGIADPVESVFPEAFLFCSLLVNSVCFDMIWHVLVEGGVEGGYVLDIW